LATPPDLLGCHDRVVFGRSGSESLQTYELSPLPHPVLLAESVRVACNGVAFNAIRASVSDCHCAIDTCVKYEFAFFSWTYSRRAEVSTDIALIQGLKVDLTFPHNYAECSTCPDISEIRKVNMPFGPPIESRPTIGGAKLCSY
jgi:hypothetical protein